MTLEPKLTATNSETTALSTQTRSQLLAAIPEESVWLANFVSPRTKQTYQVAVQSFIAFHAIETPEELYSGIGQSHLIAWREHLTQTGASLRTVQNRLAAVSSLFQASLRAASRHAQPDHRDQAPQGE